MKISPDIIYLEIQPNALLLRQNFDSQKVSVTECQTEPFGFLEDSNSSWLPA
jgi:hypothetical protein